MIADGEDYWHNGWNILDFVVMLLCVASFFVYALEQGGQRGDGIANLVVLIIRYAAQALRLLSLVSRAHKTSQRQDAQSQPIIFESNSVIIHDIESSPTSQSHSRSGQFRDA